MTQQATPQSNLSKAEMIAIKKVHLRAAQDDAFYQLCLTDPQAALAEVGLKEATHEIIFVEEEEPVKTPTLIENTTN